MSSETSSKKTSEPLIEFVRDALTSREYNDALETTVNVNVTDALLAIAHAINRLAAVHEKAQDRFDRDVERRQRIVDQIREGTEEVSDDFPRGPKGHA
jgi:hypothetical protein